MYNFCVAVDDKDMKITHVIRAEEHLSNTLRQMLIFEAIGHEPPVYVIQLDSFDLSPGSHLHSLMVSSPRFILSSWSLSLFQYGSRYAHCSLILGQDRSKLSKRHGATSVAQFAEQGFIPEAMMNYLANLGWNDGTDKEIYTPEALTQAFSLERVVKTPAMFDMVKLTWVNGQHIKALTPERMQSEVRSVMGEGVIGDGPVGDAYVAALASVTQGNVDLMVEVPPIASSILEYPLERTLSDNDAAAAIAQEESWGVICATLVRDAESGTLPMGKEEDFGAAWKAYMKGLGKELGLKGKALFQPVRLALTGKMSGSDVGAQVQMIGLAVEGGYQGSTEVVGMTQRLQHIASKCSAPA